MAYLHTILAYPSNPRLKGALNRIYAYLSRYRAGRNGGIDFDHPSVGSLPYRFQQSSSPVRPQIFSANQSRKGRKNPEPGTAVPGKETKSPLGDGTTNLLVRLHSNLKSIFIRQQLELFREIHSAAMVF
jgi:hypothetical protein